MDPAVGAVPQNSTKYSRPGQSLFSRRLHDHLIQRTALMLILLTNKYSESFRHRKRPPGEP